MDDSAGSASNPDDQSRRHASDPPSADLLHRLLIERVVDYAIFALDVNGNVATWNPGAERLQGYTAAEIIGKHFSVFYPPERVAEGFPQHELAEAARTGRFEDEGWRVRKDGSRLWANVVITALRDDGGALVGFAKVTRDLTARREAEMRLRELAASEAARQAAEARAAELARLTKQLEEQAMELESQTEEAQSLAEEVEQSNEALQTALVEAEEARDAANTAERFSRGILESISDPFVVQDGDWRFVYVNDAAAAVFEPLGYRTPTELHGRVVWEAFPELRGSAYEREMRRAMESRTPVTFEAFDAEHGTWAQMFCYPLPDGGLATQWKDVTARKQAEEAAHYLSRASEVLGASLDYQTTLSELARLVVPDLADWCAVDMAVEGTRTERLAVAHVDPERVAYAKELERRYPSDPNAPSGVPHVIRTGEPELLSDIPDELLVATSVDAEHLRIARALGLRSAMVVPIAARGTVLGALTLVSAESRRRYGAADLALAVELGRRAGAAVDNARLLHEARESAERITRLQRVTAGLAAVITPEEVARTVIDEGRAALAATAAAFALLGADGEMEIVHVSGLTVERWRDQRRFPLDAPLPLPDAARTREPIWLESRGAVAARYPRVADASLGVADAWCALPLVAGPTVVGAIAFGFAGDHPFAEEDRAFGLALAQQAAQAVERARLYAAERVARAEAEDANRAKSAFLATMSHELRTPLNAIGGYAELLELGIYGATTAAQRDALDRIQQSKRHLQALIEDVLSFARIEAGRLSFEIAEVPVGALVAGIEPLVAPQLHTKGIAFERAPTDAALALRADAEKVRQILLNVLSNAIKFTPEGGRITLRASRRDGEADIAISDTGPGIPGDKLEAIFDPFVQLGRSLTNSQEGAGLGLAISRNLARGMGGDLRAESEEGAGATFILTLPAVANAA